MHTPTPWMQYNSVENKWIGNRDTGEIVADKPNVSIRDADARWEANAALIVKAVNSYEAMLKALKGVLHHNEGLKPEYKMSPSLVYHVRKAVALAEGKDGE